jgi:hypothetical protein
MPEPTVPRPRLTSRNGRLQSVDDSAASGPSGPAHDHALLALAAEHLQQAVNHVDTVMGERLEAIERREQSS